MNEIRILSGDDVNKALSMDHAIEAMNDAFRQISSGAAKVPVRTHLGIGHRSGDALFMPVYLPDAKKIGLKAVTVFGENPAKGLPLIHGLVMVFDGEDGRPLALIDGERLTAIRTGAASGLATRLLARKDARTLAVFGAGVQARSQFSAVCAVRPIERALLFSPNSLKNKSFVEEMTGLTGLPIEINPSPQRLSDADIICTATTSPRPVFEDAHVAAGVHINAVGAYRPDTREIPGPTVARSRIIVDQREACLAEAGDLVLATQDGLFPEHCPIRELGELVGRVFSRESEREITLFKSVGNAAQDLAAAALVLDRARDLGLGVLARL